MVSTTIDGIQYTLNNIDKTATVARFCICLHHELTRICVPSSIYYKDELFNVTKIGEYAFSECRSLETIDIPDSVIEVGAAVFYNCENLQFVKMSDKIQFLPAEWITGVVDLEFGNCDCFDGFFTSCRSLRSVQLPNGLKKISPATFKGCSALSSIVIPEGVTSIDYGAFEGCSSLENIIIPQSITEIGDKAFKDCGSLKSIFLPKKAKLGKQVFNNGVVIEII